jgi:hypothetical protein
MLEVARGLAIKEATIPRQEALRVASDALDAEIRREQELAHLSGQTSGLRDLRTTMRDECLAAISSAFLRLDALRLIWRT